ncbi:hypothetical protein Pmani_037889, partial [Petrolisthes manimaculis]
MRIGEIMGADGVRRQVKGSFDV